jgi:hypothetical protein
VKDLPDLRGITLRDLKDLERALERPIGIVMKSLADGDVSKIDADVLAGLVWIRLRREDPAVTLDDVWAMDLSAFDELELDPKVSLGPNLSTGSPRKSRGRGAARPSPSAT